MKIPNKSLNPYIELYKIKSAILLTANLWIMVDLVENMFELFIGIGIVTVCSKEES